MAERSALRQLVVDMAKAALSSLNCQHATAYKPLTLATAQLPFAYTQRARGQYDTTRFGHEEFFEVVTLELVVVLTQQTLGILGQAEAEADRCFELLQDYFVARTRQALDDGEAITLAPTGDQGLRTVSFDQTPFYAAILNVAVENERTVPYQGV